MKQFNDDFTKLLQLRLQDRNSRLAEKITLCFEKLNSRGLLNSSISIGQIFKLIETELEESLKTIIETFTDCFRAHRKNNNSAIERILLEALSGRTQELDVIFNQRTHNIRKGLMNKKLLVNFTLSKKIDLLNKELLVCLNTEIQKLEQVKGTNFKQRTMNYFFDNKLVASVSIIFSAIILFAAFLKAVEYMKKFMEG